MADADGKVSRHSPSWSAFTGQSAAQQRGWGWPMRSRPAIGDGSVGAVVGAGRAGTLSSPAGCARVDGWSVLDLLCGGAASSTETVGCWNGSGALTDISDRRWSDSLRRRRTRARRAGRRRSAAGSPHFVARGVEGLLTGPRARCSESSRGGARFLPAQLRICPPSTWRRLKAWPSDPASAPAVTCCLTPERSWWSTTSPPSESGGRPAGGARTWAEVVLVHAASCSVPRRGAGVCRL